MAHLLPSTSSRAGFGQAVTHRSRHIQSGVTLVELMVALVIGLVLTLTAVATLVASKTGYTSVDSSAQVRENARFAMDLIRRVALQAGYERVGPDAIGNKDSLKFMYGDSPVPFDPDISGFDDALFDSTTGFPPTLQNGSRSDDCTVADSSCNNGSDVLVVRYHGSSLSSDTATADGSIINCAGIGEPDVATGPEDRAFSVFHVARSSISGEPVLMCSYRDAAGAWVTRPLVHGVEGFQVLYGMNYDGAAVAPNTAVAAGSPSSSPRVVADRYVRADQVIVPGNPLATQTNWQQVRSLRIGLLVRGPVGSALDRTASGGTYFPLGADRSNAADVGTQLSIAADGRLRHTLSFTIHLRNRQKL